MNTRLPSLAALLAFEAAARHLSFKQAAAELHLTPGAISQQIKALEEQLGTRLFVRLTRALELTQEGRAMLPELQAGLASIVAAVEAAQRQDPAGPLGVCAPPAFAARWLLPRLPGFAKRCPEVDVRLSRSVQTIDRPDVADSDPATMLNADLVIRFGRGDYPGFVTETLFAPAYVPVCSPELLNGEHPLRTPEDLRWHPLIQDDTVPDLEDRPSWDEWLGLAGLPELPRIRGSCFDDTGLVITAAISGQGVALAAKPLISADVAAGRLAMPFALSIPSKYAYFVTHLAVAAERPAALAFRSWLLEAARLEDDPAGTPAPAARPARS